MSRGIFTGRCYLCGEMCGRTYCHEHKWAAGQLALPYRRDPEYPNGKSTGTDDRMETLRLEVREALDQLKARDRKLRAWRTLNGTRKEPVG